MLLNLFLAIISRRFLWVVLGAFLIIITSAIDKKKAPRKKIGFMIFTIGFMYLAVSNLIFGDRLYNSLIYKYGESGTGLVLSEEQTNNLYNDEPVYRYPIVLKKADGQSIETAFESWDFNVYPKPEGGRYQYPEVGEEFNLKYLKENPDQFVILANEGNYSEALNCDQLKKVMDEEERKMNFDKDNEAFKKEYEVALRNYQQSNCAGAENTEEVLKNEAAEVTPAYWQNHGPLEFLDHLKSQSNKPELMAEIPAKEWIKKEDVLRLMALIESNDPAAPVLSATSSYSAEGRTSTVGNEAMFLIEGYRKGIYPPEGSSIAYGNEEEFGFKADREEIKEWWEAEKDK